MSSAFSSGRLGRRALPIIVGIAGGTGSGKTTIAHRIAAGLPANAAVVIEHDSYYYDGPAMPEHLRNAGNFDHPDALETGLLIDHIKALRAGRGAELPQYDFGAHRRLDQTRSVGSVPIVIVEGILALAVADLRALFDLKIFVDTDADIRIMRRVRRDMEQRGRDFSSIREQYYRTVRPMHLAYVEPSKRFADIVIPEGGDNRVALDTIVGRLRYDLSSAGLSTD
ncbi:MAG: uridine kinase [Deltaproteobacteria bacterium]|nr:uridine kinase [Deltaproteobacteria bacterium]